MLEAFWLLAQGVGMFVIVVLASLAIAALTLGLVAAWAAGGPEEDTGCAIGPDSTDWAHYRSDGSKLSKPGVRPYGASTPSGGASGSGRSRPSRPTASTPLTSGASSRGSSAGRSTRTASPIGQRLDVVS